MTDFYWKMELGGLSVYQAEMPGMLLFARQKRDAFSFVEGWEARGLYLFAAVESELAALLEKVLRLNRQFQGRIRLLWVENPKDVFSLWRYHALLADDEGKITGQQGFRYGEYYFNIFLGQKISCTQDGFSISGKTPSGMFKSPGMTFPFEGGLTVHVGGKVRPGSIGYAIQSNCAGQNLMELLGAGMYYAAMEKRESEEEAGERLLYSPVLECRETVQMKGVLYPASPLSSNDTFLLFPLGRKFPGRFVNTMGERLELEAREDAALVFERYWKKGVYLGLSGHFLLSQGTDRKEMDFLCGSEGLEYICMEKEAEIQFMPGGNAFLTEDGKFGRQVTAAYLGVPAGSRYYCQPHAAPLFVPAEGQKGMLTLHKAPLLRLGGEESLPVFPYFGWETRSACPADTGRFEAALFRHRYGLLAGPVKQAANGGEFRAVSSQGLLAGLSEGIPETWNWLSVGRAMDGNYMKLLGISGALQRELMSSDIFMVFYQPKDLLSHISGTEHLEWSLDGWRFLAAPGSWRQEGGDSDTLMLLKYGTKESIKERLQEQAVFAAALARCYNEERSIKEEFADFLRAVEDPNFQGCMILNCPVDTESCSAQMQPEVRVMLEGIEPKERKRLCAHHLILHKSRICIEEELGLYPASVEALVCFQDGTPIGYSRRDDRPEAEYATTGLTLKIEDSRITRMESVMELLLNRLFGSSLSRDGRQGGNSLILDGQLRQEAGKNLFVFRLREAGQFMVEGGSLKEVQVQTVDLTCQRDGGTFAIGGRLYFSLQEDCDLFGYGLEEDGEDKGLPFEGLLIQEPGKGLPLRAVYSGISLRAEADGGRKNAMVSRFPMELERFVYVEEGRLPEDLGYLLMQSPVRQSPLHGDWYGLLWRIPLGSLGELSENSVMDLEILTAWSGAGQEQPGCWLGCRLPGLSGGAGLELQGLVKLGFQSVEIRTGAEGDGRLCYGILLNQFVVRVLWASFPPGSNCIHIVSDREGRRLGWFAGYANPASGEGEG